MTIKLSGPMAPPKAGGEPTHAMVLLHGYGSDGRDLIGLAGYWRDLLPGALFVAPNAPERCRDNPSGYQWFPIAYDRADYRFEGAASAAPVIIGFLRDLWAQTQVTPERTILAGFSQGAMMSLNVAVSLDVRLMGVVAFSGALIAPEGFLDQPTPQAPICLVHGELDQVVDPDLSEHAAALLRGKGFDVRLHISPGAPHTIAPDGLDFASAFIAEIAGEP